MNYNPFDISGGIMAIVGSGVVSIINTGDMESTVRSMLSLYNTPINVDRRINEFKSIESKGRDLIDILADNNSSIENLINSDTEEKLLINRIKNEHLIRTVMETVSIIADYTDKACCMIFFMNKGAHLRFKKGFKLSQIKTDYDYINEDNAKINEIVKTITEEVFNKSAEVDAIREEFRANIAPEVFSYFFDDHDNYDILNFTTNNFKRDLSRRLKEAFTAADWNICSKFLIKYKAALRKIAGTDTAYYCKMFGISLDDWYTRGASYLALEPVIQLNALDLLA
jgi:molybdopterin converting factor small subunit